MPKKISRPGNAKPHAAGTKPEPVERQKPLGMSKGAWAAERASAGIGTDDRDPDNNWFRPSKRA
jgi:hypothetical protein